jgi:hypothetical protein
LTRHPLPLTPGNREKAHAWVDRALSLFKPGQAWVMELREAKRTDDQNRALWGALGQIVRQRPVHNGVQMDADLWKAVFMQAAGHEITFVPTLEGTGLFPVGLRSSRLTKAEFADLLEFILAWCAREGLEIKHFDNETTERSAA